MTEKTIILLTVDFLIFMLLLKLVFKSFKEIKKCFYYLIKPDILSIFQKDFDNDFTYTHKFLFVVLIMAVLGLIEVAIFY